jgi:fructose-1,6-bisphosphatase I
MSTGAMTLARHIREEERKHPGATGELSILLQQLSYAAKLLSREMRRAALVGQLGLVGETNATGDAQKKLDLFGNNTVVEAFVGTGLVAAIVSEELEETRHISSGSAARYVLCIDPLDGSSNTDINGIVGTIFGVYHRPHPRPLSTRGEGPGVGPLEDVLRKGSEQVAAGYVMYGPSTLLVYTSGHGVHGFTLDHDIGEFLLSHPDIRCPSRGRAYSVNLGHEQEWHPGIRKLIRYLGEADTATHRPYSLRYTGALVADVHRCLIEGGFYCYPADAAHSAGKLRLLYECAPLALVIEQAGGRAGTGTQPILEIQPDSIHQRVPFVIGSADDVALYERFLQQGHA